MKILKYKNFTKGWLVGNFKPSILKTKKLEVGIAYHLKGEPTINHYHTRSTEYNLIINGSMMVNKKKLKKGDIFIYKKNEISNCKFLSDTSLLVLRTPSAPGDKVIVYKKKLK